MFKRGERRISLESIHSNEIRSEAYNPENNNSSQDQTTEAVLNEPSEFSEFSETDCYEPVSAQHLRIDFTPNKDDDEYQRQKCSDFWKYISSVPEIQHLRVYPQKSPEIPQEAKKKTPSKSSNISSGTKDGATTGEAVSVLKLIKDKGMVDQTFEVEMPRTHCPESSSKDDTQRKKKKKAGPSVRGQPTCKCEPLKQPGDVSQLKQSGDVSELKTMLKEMQDWDAKHPRSMEPPRHPPMHCCVLEKRKNFKQP